MTAGADDEPLPLSRRKVSWRAPDVASRSVIRLTVARRRTYHSRPEGTGTSGSARSGRRGSHVIDLGRARDARRLGRTREELRAVAEVNKKALARLFQTGLIFSRHGARLGRDLLLAQQHLLKASDLLARAGEVSGRRASEALYGQVQGLLARTSALTARSDVLLARR